MPQIALLDVDIHNSSYLPQPLVGLDERSNREETPMALYQKALDDLVHEYQGEVWTRAGDGAVFLFPKIARALEAGMTLLDRLWEVNSRCQANDLQGLVLFTRIGIHLGDAYLQDIAAEKRGTVQDADLNTVGRLQKNCPIGRIAISSQAYEAIGVRRPLFRPSLVQGVGEPTFVLSERFITPQEEGMFKGMDDSQKRSMPPIPFLAWESIRPDEGLTLRTVAQLLEEPILVILGESSDRQGTLASAATSDAVGIMEAVAAVKSNPALRVAVDVWSDTGDLVTGRHMLVVGSGVVNQYAFAINGIMRHFKFWKSDGKVLNQLVATANDRSKTFGVHGMDERDAGFISVSKSPFNPRKNLIWVAGVNGMATQAAAQLLKDLVVDGGACLARLGYSKQPYPIGCVVVPSVDPDTSSLSLSDYYRKWRIRGYEVVWAVDRSGNYLQSDRRRGMAS